MDDGDRRPLIRHLGFGARAVPYEEAWELQRAVHAQVSAGTLGDTVLLLEHQPVFTAGKRTEPHERPWDGTPVVDVDRGGKITWHGPGQIVGYPIVRLARPVDVVAYVRRLERVLIDVCAQLGVTAGRVKGRSGVWVGGDSTEGLSTKGLSTKGLSTEGLSTEGLGREPLGTEHGAERKVAAIGIRVAQGVTMHGFALNCDPDLSWYSRIVPCGIPDAGVTSLSAELGRDVTVDEVLPVLERHLTAADLAGHGATGGVGAARLSSAPV